jgi:hypothetical protein
MQWSGGGTGAPMSIGVDPAGGAGRNGFFNSYLPGGNWADPASQNHLRNSCESFVFLTVVADLTNVGGSATNDVYVPCYYS